MAGPALVLASVLAIAAPTPKWSLLAPGLEHATFDVDKATVHVVRIDPARARLGLHLASENGGRSRTAGHWCEQQRLAVAINAGMFLTDLSTNVGYLVHEGRPQNPRWSSKYQSVLLLHPKDAGLAPAQLTDRDAPGFDRLLAGYATAVQNLRLIKAPGVSVWKPNGRRWSEAAVGSTRDGKILFIFTRTGFSMADLNARLLELPIDLERLAHVEGGPEASLSIHAGGVDLDLAGSFETGFNERDDNGAQWPIPNVLGVAR